MMITTSRRQPILKRLSPSSLFTLKNIVPQLLSPWADSPRRAIPFRCVTFFILLPRSRLRKQPDLLYNPNMKSILLFAAYFAAMNLIAFCLAGIDKRRAGRHAFRIPESVLFLFSFAGGSAGMLLGMLLFRHKTKKKRFMIGIPLILILQILLVFLFLKAFEPVVFL